MRVCCSPLGLLPEVSASSGVQLTPCTSSKPKRQRICWNLFNTQREQEQCFVQREGALPQKGESKGLLVFSRDSSSHREATVIRRRLCLGPKCLCQLLISRELKPQEQYSILQGHVASCALISCLISSFCSLI